MSDKFICLFDMDGTLTLPRKEIEWSMVALLRELSNLPAEVGIVSGSPWSYIEQQMGVSWVSLGGIFPGSLKIMPCNGTQLLKWDITNKDFKVIYDVNFKEYMNDLTGKNVYIEFVKHILELQMEFIHEYQFESLTGNFLSYRSSMINWSPVGRDAMDREREAFVKLDQEKDVRNKLRESLRVRLDASGLHETELNLGGSTSIDIHPVGWDKTHALIHCGDATVFFVGDKCMPGGNDHSLYEVLKPHGRAFSTTGPEQTAEIIRTQIIPQIKAQIEGKSK